MAKSVKLKNEVYWDSSSVSCNQTILDKILNYNHKELDTAGWYRIGEWDNDTGFGSFLINLYTSYRTVNNMAYLISLSAAYKTAKFANLSCIINGKAVDKIRFVRNSNNKDQYLEIHYAVNTLNDVYCNVLQWSKHFGTVNFLKVEDNTGTVLASLDL